MLSFLRKPAPPVVDAFPLTIEAAGGALRRTFAAGQIDSLRHMLTDLIFSEALPSRVALTSALRGEGVSHTALALGATLAHDTGKRVCVVELNWLAPGMLAALNPAQPEVPARRRGGQPALTPTPAMGRPGIAEVLAGAVTLDEALIATSEPGLSLMPAGALAAARRPTLARSVELQQLIATIAERNDYLILDLPAVLETSDAIALAALGEACALVVRQGVTPISEVQRALSDIRQVPMLGIILNQARIATPRWLHKLIPQE